MRILYVALTRARDRLIMTYASQTLEKDLQDILLRMTESPMELLVQDVVCPGEWVLMAALQRTEAGELFRLAQCQNSNAMPGEPAWKISVCSTEAVSNSCRTEQAVKQVVTDQQLRQLKEGLCFRYPFAAATQAPSKQTATQRKGRQKDEEAVQETQPPKRKFRQFRKPGFVDQVATAADHGNATHAVMEHIRFDRCADTSAVEEEICRLVREGFLTEQQSQMVKSDQIAAFFRTELGKHLANFSQVLREFKFSILDDGIHYDPDLDGERILLQGVVDCAIIEEDGITVLDFKTDSVTEQTLAAAAERYRLQVATYAQAISKIYGKPVKQALLYFFQAGQFVEIA